MNPAQRDLSDRERLDWLRLIRSENIGPRTFSGLMDRFGSAEAALRALPELVRKSRSARDIKICAPDDAEREMEAAARLGVAFVAICESRYPASLRAIDSAPPLIGVAGSPAVLARPSISVIGSRNASASGLVFTDRLTRGIGAGGYAVVSGLARGVDGPHPEEHVVLGEVHPDPGAAAHQSSLDTGTVAVLAGGHDRIYPSEHLALARRILEHGAVISEMPIGWEPRARDFPRRNRIVSGLSLGTVVVEASRRSGSLITARFANEQGREVFAVPGSPLDTRAEGTNDLLRQGATLCTSAEDVLGAVAPRSAPERASEVLREPQPPEQQAEPMWEEVDLFSGCNGPPASLTRVGEAEVAGAAMVAEAPTGHLLDLIGAAPVQIDDLMRIWGGSPQSVMAALTELEMMHKIRRHDGNRVSLLIA